MEPAKILEGLHRLVPEASIDDELMLRLLGAVKVPNSASVLPMLLAIERLSRSICWTKDLSWPSWFPTEAVTLQIACLTPYGTRFFSGEKPQLSGIQDDYPVYSGIVDARFGPPLWLEQYRSMLVLVACRWSDRENLPSVIQIFASAIRGAKRGGDRSAAFSALGSPGTLDLVVVAAQKLDVSGHAALSDVWLPHLVPELSLAASQGVGPADDGSEPTAPAQPSPGPSRPPSQGSGKSTKRSKRGLRGPNVVRVVANGRDKPTVHERAEAPEDNGLAVFIADVPIRRKHFAGRRTALFNATQSIWSNNHLLLTEHVESLGAGEAEALGRYLIAEGDLRLQSDPAAVRALAWLALSLATGRGANPLASLQVLTAGQKRDLRKPWVIDVVGGRIIQPVLRPEQSYTPDEEESEWLEASGDQMALVLAPELVKFLQRVCASGVTLNAQSPDAIKADIHTACRLASTDLGLRIFTGRVRRALGCLLQDAGRDLVATMLITGDTHGLSTAPLYYAAPREIDLQRLYGEVTASIFGGEPSLPAAISEARLGAKLLVPRKLRYHFTRKLGALLMGSRAKKADLGSVVLTHNALLDHVVGMMLDTAGHRPVDQLFRLTRGELDLDGCLALFQDKNVDPAHETRFAAMPMTLCDQLAAYSAHLRALLELLPRAQAEKVGHVLAGKAPLFFQLDSEGSVRDMSLSEWLARVPSAWRELPPNFGRTTIATRGRDMGGSPEALATQLGHLEAVGFPFGEDSPTEPILLASELAPVLDRLARDGGWKVRTGYKPGAEEGTVWETAGPLKNWLPIIEAHVKKARTAAHEVAIAQKALVYSQRAAGEARVLEALSITCPSIAVELLADTRDAAAVLKLDHLGPDEVVRIQEQLRDACDGDMVSILASMNALTKLLKRLRARNGWEGYVPFSWRAFRRSETTPFFPGMLLARRQVEDLRTQFELIAVAAPKGSGISLRDWDFARTAIALCLFGFVDEPGQVLGLVANRVNVRRSASLPDVVLVQWCDEPRAVAGLRGLADIALCSLAKRYRGDRSGIDADVLDHVLRVMLPKGSCVGKGRILDRICSTVAVTNRIELSGAARLALSTIGGSTPAAVERQIAWLDGDPVIVGSAAAAAPEEVATGPLTATVGRQGRVGESRRQYINMLALFPSEYTDTALPRTGITIKAADLQRSRAAVLAEFEALISDGDSNNVVAALALWCAKMLRNGTLEEPNPAFGTIKTYLGIVGGPLLRQTEGMRLRDLDEAELAQVYLDLIEMKHHRERERTARELLHFHAVVAPLVGLADIDTSEFNIYIGTGGSNVDAELLLPQEVDLAIRQQHGSSQNLSITTEERRAHRQSTSLLSLLSASAARSGEPLGMRLTEFTMVRNSVLVSFVPNPHRRIKTRAGARVVDITHRLTANDDAHLIDWLAAEKARLPSVQLRSSYLYSAVNLATDLTPKPRVHAQALHAIKAVTRRQSERLHRIRHMGLSEGLLWLFLNCEDRSRVGFLRSLAARAVPHERVLFPRDLHRQTAVIGHRRPVTSIRVYMHMGWALRARSDRWIQERVTRRSASVALGVSLSRTDQIRRGEGGLAQSQAWLNSVSQPRRVHVDTLTSPDIQAAVNSQMATLSAVEVGQLLAWTETGNSTTTAGLSLGATSPQLQLVEQAVAEYAAQIGRDFISRGVGNARTGAVTRRVSAARHLYKLWDIDGRDDGDPERRMLLSVVSALFARAKPVDQDSIVLPSREATLLAQLLATVGHDPVLVSVESHSSPVLRVVRVKRTVGSSRYAGRELKRIFGVIWVRHRINELINPI